MAELPPQEQQRREVWSYMQGRSQLPAWAESLPSSIRRQQREANDHAMEALRYAMSEHPPLPPEPRLVRLWLALRYRLAWWLRDLADRIEP